MEMKREREGEIEGLLQSRNGTRSEEVRTVWKMIDPQQEQGWRETRPQPRSRKGIPIT
jgi:hypothetical protein